MGFPLLLFIGLMVIFFPIYSAYGVYILAKAVQPFAAIFPKFKFVAIFVTFDTGLFVLAGIYCGISLYKIRKNALKCTKLFLILFLFFSILNPLLVFISDLPHEMMSPFLGKMPNYISQRVGFFIIWYLYFWKSNRVKAIYDLTPNVSDP